MAPDPELADEVVGLHAQQAAEKYLKAVLAHRGITYRRVHSITYLLGLLEDHEVAPPPRAPELEAFTPWAPQARYDLDTEGAVLDREAAVELVRGVQEWARAELSVASGHLPRCLAAQPRRARRTSRSDTRRVRAPRRRRVGAAITGSSRARYRVVTAVRGRPTEDRASNNPFQGGSPWSQAPGVSPPPSRRSSCSARARRRRPRAPSISKATAAPAGCAPRTRSPRSARRCEMGVTTLELDTGVTKDGVVVVSHERRISSLECQGPYVGKLIHELTYAQIQKLDCGTRHPADPSTDPFVGTQEAVPGTHMPSLAQVFQLVNRYGADKVQFDIETKRDPTLPKETVGPTTFAKKVIAVISRYHMTKRSVLQSFDWSTLQAARKIKPRLRRAALAQATTIFPGTPWTGGIDIKPQPVRRRPRARGGRQAPRPGPLGQLPRHHRHAHQGLAPARPDDHPVDRRRPGRHGGGHRPRPRRPHHRLPRQGPRRDGRQGPRPARAVRVALRHRGPPRRARLPAREHAERLRLRPRPRRRHAGDGHRRDQGRRARHVPQPPGQRRALPRHGAGHAGRSALPLRGQEHQGPHAGPDQDARLRLHRSGLPQAGPPARREDADAAGGLRPRGLARRHARALQHRDEDQPAGRRHRALRRHDGQARQGDRGQRPAGPGHDPVLRLAHDHAVQAARSAHRHGRAHLAVLGRRLRRPRRRVLAGGDPGRSRRSSARGPTAWTGGSSATWASS